MPLIQVSLIAGRTPALRLDLARSLTDSVQEVLGCPRDSIRVLITEIAPQHWVVGGEPVVRQAED